LWGQSIQLYELRDDPIKPLPKASAGRSGRVRARAERRLAAGFGGLNHWPGCDPEGGLWRKVIVFGPGVAPITFMG